MNTLVNRLSLVVFLDNIISTDESKALKEFYHEEIYLAR